jgi:hypothetical protein
VANIKTPKQLAYEAALDERRSHHNDCPALVFPRRDEGYKELRWEDGDIRRCKHGEIMVFKSWSRYYGVVALTLKKKRHPILYMRALKLLAAEEAMRAEERDGGD